MARLHFDADGADGLDASNGRAGSSGFLSGADGGDGGDAGAAIAGSSARDITLQLTVPRITATVGSATSDHAFGVDDVVTLSAVGGRGGDGGTGGRGGSSYLWTETERNPDGTTRVRSRSNPGGSRGPSGSRGSTPRSTLHSGYDGSDGAFSIREAMPDGTTRTWPRSYDLVIEGFDIAEQATPDADGVFEPGEVFELRDIIVANCGGMPTPRGAPIRLRAASGEWLEPVGDPARAPDAIEPGHRAVVPGPLRCRIVRPVIDEPAPPFAIDIETSPIAWQCGPPEPPWDAFSRRYEAAWAPRTIHAQFPIHIDGDVLVLRSLAPGEASRFCLSIANISSCDIGILSDRTRRVRVQVARVSGDLDPTHLQFTGPDGVTRVLHDEPGPESGYAVDIDHIAASTAHAFEGTLSVDEAALPWAGATVEVTLWLAGLDDRDTLQIVHRQRVSVRAEPGYVASDDAKSILITHDQIERDVWLAWSDLFDGQLQLPTDEWSIARYGHFDQDAVLGDGRSLRAHVAQKLVVVLNQPFHAGPSALKDLPSDYLRSTDFRTSVTVDHTRYLVAGSLEFALGQWLEPTATLRAGGDDYPDPNALFEALQHDTDPYTEQTFGEEIMARWDTVVVDRHHWPFGMPDTDACVLRAAHRLSRALHRLHPHRRYVLVMRPDVLPTRSGGGWLRPRWRCGTIEVRRSLDHVGNAAVALRLDEAESTDRRMVDRADTRFAVLMALPFEQRLDVLNRLLRERAPRTDDTMAIGFALVRTLLVDLSTEQQLATEVLATDDGVPIHERLPALRQLCEHPLMTGLAADDPAWQWLFLLAGGVLTLTRSVRPWWGRWGRRKHLWAHNRACVEPWLSDVFDGHVTDIDGDITMDLETAREPIEAAARSFRLGIRAYSSWWSRLWATRRARHAVSLAMQDDTPIGTTVFLESDTWTDPNERVWSAEQFDAAVEAERDRLRRQAALREGNAANRREMLVAADWSAAHEEAEARTVVVDIANG